MKVFDYVITFFIPHDIDKVFGYIRDHSSHSFDFLNKYVAVKDGLEAYVIQKKNNIIKNIEIKRTLYV